MAACPMPSLVLAEGETPHLQTLANSRSRPHSIVQQAPIVLACGAGETNLVIAQRMGVQPHRQKHGKPLTHLFFVQNVRDIVGPYFNPLDNVVLLCIDEKT